MEKSKTLDTTKETVKNSNGDWGGTSCPWWIFGNKKSADNDLKEQFEIVDNEAKD